MGTLLFIGTLLFGLVLILITRVRVDVSAGLRPRRVVVAVPGIHASGISKKRTCGAAALVQAFGPFVAPPIAMDENTSRERGAQEEKPGQREVKRARATRQDTGRPPEGRDSVPEDEVAKGHRTTDSPWMGGG